jgi:3-oxoacyl-[acyl-carrier-protein] synthase II
MSASSRRVVITGVGVLSPLGSNVTDFWQALCAGRSGIRPIRAFDASGLPVRIAGEVEGFDPKDYIVDKIHRRSIRMMARTIQLGVAAANLALADGRVEEARLDPTRFGVEFGAGLIASELPELAEAARASINCQPNLVDLAKWGEQGISNIQPLWMLKYLPNMPACHVSIQHNAQGPNNTITESDVASLLALGEAFRTLRRDGADFFLVGGVESKVNPLSMVRQCLFETLSHRNDAPEKACRPFDRARDGMVIGEGGTVLVVEDLDHAQRRGARIYAEVAGFGSAFDSRMSGSGITRAVRAALAEANLPPGDLDHVNANGLATPQADIMEARGLQPICGNGPDAVEVVALKGYLGNLGAAAGTTEVAASALALHHRLLPGTLNHEEPDLECPVRVHVGSPRPVRRGAALAVGFTPAGQCAAVVLRRWE